jgi:zona occludens toxin (predicted ATPase)
MKRILMVLVLATVVVALSALYALPALAAPNDPPLDSCQRAVGNAPLVEVVGTSLASDPMDFCLLSHPAPASGITI